MHYICSMTKTTNITFRIPSDTLERARIHAKADGRTLNNYIVWALERRIAMTPPANDKVKKALLSVTKKWSAADQLPGK